MAIKSDPAQAKLDIQTPEQSREELQAELLAVLIDEERKEAEIKGLKHSLSQKKAELEGLVLKRRETMMKLENGQVIFNVNANADSRDDDDTDDDLDAAYPSDDELAEYDECDTPEPDSETKMLPGAVVEAEEDEIEIEEDEETEDAA